MPTPSQQAQELNATGIAHKEAGIGQIGAGITTAPMPCFNEAIAALAASLRREGGDGP